MSRALWLTGASLKKREIINEPRRFPPDKPNNLANRLTLSTRGGTPRYIRTRVKISRRYTAQSSFHPCVSHPYAKRQPWHRRRLFRRWPATSADGQGCCRSAGGPWRARPSGARGFDPTRASTVRAYPAARLRCPRPTRRAARRRRSAARPSRWDLGAWPQLTPRAPHVRHRGARQGNG